MILLGRKKMGDKRKNRKTGFLFAALDIVVYSAISLTILMIHPSYDDKLSSLTIVWQYLYGMGLIAACRIMLRIYWLRWQFGKLLPYIRLLFADFSAGVLYLILQGTVTRPIELATAFAIMALTLLATVVTRITYKVLYDISLNVSSEIPFSPPDISELEINEVADTLRSGWITTGPKTKKLEAMITDWLGSARTVCLNSQTACAEMTLRLLGIGPGDEVITCAYTYTATASVVCHVGAKLVLVDCSESSGSVEMDYDAMEKAITPRTKVIIPIDLGGVPCDYDRIFEIVNRKRDLFVPSNEIQHAIGRIAVVADAAHAFGASYHGKMIGSVADFSNFSFHAVKNFTTGEGGAVAWNHIEGISDDDLYHRIQLLSLHGQSKDALAKSKVGAWEYDIVGPWYKCNMTDIMAAIGLAQLERYPKMLERRKQIIRKYDEAFRPLGMDVLTHYCDSYSSSGHLYLVRIPGITAQQRNEIIVKMAKQKVVCNVHYKPLPMHTAYINLGFDMKDYPVAYRKFANEITLPLYSKLTDKEVDVIIGTFISVVKEYI